MALCVANYYVQLERSWGRSDSAAAEQNFSSRWRQVISALFEPFCKTNELDAPFSLITGDDVVRMCGMTPASAVEIRLMETFET